MLRLLMPMIFTNKEKREESQCVNSSVELDNILGGVAVIPLIE
jgi:hypothetical protein